MSASSTDHDLLMDPINVIEFELGDFAGPKPKASEKQENCPVPTPDEVIGTRGNQLLYLDWFEKFWNL